MSTTLRRRSGVTLLASLALVLSACGANDPSRTTETLDAGEGASASAETGRLVVLNPGTELNLDPAKSQSMAVTSLALVHRRLTTWKIEEGKEPEVVPDLATDTGTVSDDGLTWTYTLKDGLFFEDGTPITAADVKYGLERTFSPSLSGGLTYHRTLLAGAEGYTGPYEGQHLDSIETPDEKTIVFHLTRPAGDWPWIVSTPAFSPVPEAKDDPESYARQPVASGPYKVAETNVGVSVLLERNDKWDKSTDPVRTAAADTVLWELGQDARTSTERALADRPAVSMSAAVLTGSSLAQLSPAQAESPQISTSAAGPLQYMAINTERISDVRVRQAINYAVDKAAVQLAMGGERGGDIATTYIAPGIPGRAEYSLYATDPSGDVEQAKRLLDEAGVDGLHLRLLTTNGSDWVARAEAIAQGLARVGIEVTIDSVESNTFYERATQGDGSTYDLVLSSWNADYPSANAIIRPLFHSAEVGGGGYNMSRFSDPAIDAAIDEAAAELDENRSQELWAQLDQRIAEQSPVVPLINARNSFVHGSGVGNFIVEPFPAYPNYLVLTVEN